MSKDDLNPRSKRDHGGGLDGAIKKYGGTRADWIDLSTGINPHPYEISRLQLSDWTELPDHGAFERLAAAARQFWDVPDGAAILPAPGASAIIARIPALAETGRVQITAPTYNEHAAAFAAQDWTVQANGPADARVIVHPNNPDGRTWQASDADAPLTVIDESFCDVMPDASLIRLADRPGVIVLKSFGKFWGLAGLRLGFAIGHPKLIARLNDLTGPWSVSGPALRVGAQALQDVDWANETRARLRDEAAQLDDADNRQRRETGRWDHLVPTVRSRRRHSLARPIGPRAYLEPCLPLLQTYLRLGLPPRVAGSVCRPRYEHSPASGVRYVSGRGAWVSRTGCGRGSATRLWLSARPSAGWTNG